MRIIYKMSASYQQLEPVLVKDPRTILANERYYSVLKAGSFTNYQKWTSTSISASSINFSCPPPSASIIVDRKITLTLPRRLTFEADVAPGERVFLPNRDAPRAFGIHSMLDTIQMTLNNCSVSQNMGEIIHGLLRYNTDDQILRKEYSETASCLDVTQNYSDLIGSVRNPLSMVGDCNFGDVSGRGGFSGYKIVSNPQNNTGGVLRMTGIVDVISTEQLMLSPNYWGNGDGSGFINLTSMDFVFNFLNQAANRDWSHVNDPNFSVFTGSSTVQFANFTGPTFSFKTVQPFLNITYITPDSSFKIGPNMPVTYPYFDVLKYSTDYGSSIPYDPNVAQGTLIQSNNIQLSSIPRRIYVWARPTNSVYYSNAGITDCFYGITNLSIQFENKSGLFSNANQNQLYEISKKNHCALSWSDWSGQPYYKVGGLDFDNDDQFGGVGSVMCIELSTDIGLEDYLAPGVGGSSYNLQVQAFVKNINPTGDWDNYPVSLYVVPVMEGTFTIPSAGSALTMIGVLTRSDVLDSLNKPQMISYDDIEEINGGNFMSGLKKYGTKAIDFAKKADKFLKDSKAISKISDAASFVPGPIGDVARDVHGVASMLGYGQGGLVVGGKKMTKRQMANRLKNK